MDALVSISNAPYLRILAHLILTDGRIADAADIRFEKREEGSGRLGADEKTSPESSRDLTVGCIAGEQGGRREGGGGRRRLRRCGKVGWVGRCQGREVGRETTQVGGSRRSHEDAVDLGLN